jgi:hypothetical protein
MKTIIRTLIVLIISGCTHSVKTYNKDFVIKKITIDKDRYKPKIVNAIIQLEPVVKDSTTVAITTIMLAEDLVNKKYNEGDTVSVKLEELYVSSLLIAKTAVM